jgi:hydroxymethylbilane synthase
VNAASSATTVPEKIVIATRQSALALKQAHLVRNRLKELYAQSEIELLGLTTSGDRLNTATLAGFGGKGLFVKELEDALAQGRADIAVHSMKDVPMELPAGFVLAAILEREDPRDAFVSNRYAELAALPAGARVGTSSLRRQSQVRARYPELEVAPLRGNVGTRLAKLDAGDYDAIIVAAAGLKRLDLAQRITQMLEPEVSIPAPGQGALGIEIREERSELLPFLAPLAHRETALVVRAEREASRSLAGSCRVPLGVYGAIADDRMRLSGFVASPDGARLVSDCVEGDLEAPEALGEELAERLRQKGAAAILEQLG